jgi:Putative beta barrel porin-7 (BBP7)
MSTGLRGVVCTLLASAALQLVSALALADPALPAIESSDPRSAKSEVGKPAGLPFGLGTTAPESNNHKNSPIQEDSAGGPADADAANGLEGFLSAPPSAQIYARADTLLWWMKGAPLGIPLVSTGPIATTHHGLLTGSDATILYGAPYAPAQGGDDKQNFPMFTGGRLTLGCWLDSDRRFAIEGSGFMWGKRSAGFAIRSDSSGIPVINIPVRNTVPYTPLGRSIEGPPSLPATEDGLPASLPNDPARFDGNTGVVSGGVTITNTLRLWGYDAVGVMNLYGGSTFEFAGLLGFQYLDLAEAFHLFYYSKGESGFYFGQSGTINETFQTRNHFYGGVLGLRGRYRLGRLTADLTARVALGANNEVENVWGAFYSFNYIRPNMSGLEGIFAQPANEGRRSASRFAAVPQAQLRIGYALTPQVRITAGYDFVFFTSVLRPGDQINRNLPKGQTFQQGQDVDSTTSPTPYFNSSHFYAHGLSLGLDFRY